MSFNLGSLIIGFLILAAGGALVVFYRPIAENMASGVNSYDRIKLVGVIAIVLGFLVMTNLHSVILDWLVRLIFPSTK